MERGLAVEENDVTVDEVAVDDVTLVEVDLIRVDVAQAEVRAIALEVDVLRTRVARRSVADIAQETLAIVGIDRLREGQVHRDLLRHTELVEVDGRIGRDDRTGGEVHALAHEIATHTTGLRSEARLEGLERAT